MGRSTATKTCPLLCLAPLGLVFGIVALVQISRRAQRGKGLAVAGVAVSGVVLLIAGIATVVVDFRVWTPPARDADGEGVKPGWTTFHSSGRATASPRGRASR